MAKVTASLSDGLTVVTSLVTLTFKEQFSSKVVLPYFKEDLQDQYFIQIHEEQETSEMVFLGSIVSDERNLEVA